MALNSNAEELALIPQEIGAEVIPAPLGYCVRVSAGRSER